jgi:diguanylate cyclase (GGDEF)-like protein/PAS domain S-box-containing protein
LSQCGLGRNWRTVALAGVTIAARTIVAIPGGLEPYLPLEFSILIVASTLVAAATTPQPVAERRGTMAPSFVFAFGSLLLFGLIPAVIVSTASALVKGWIVNRWRVENGRRLLFDVTVTIPVMGVATLAYGALGGTRGSVIWPAQALAVAAAAIVCGVLEPVSAQLVAPLLFRRTIERVRPRSLLLEAPPYIVGAAIAVGLVDILDSHAWQILLAVALPLFFAYRAYCRSVARLEEVHCRQEVIAEAQGMSVIDGSGRIVLWNDALERIVHCRREQAVGGPILNALPSLKSTSLPRAVEDALKDRMERTLSSVGVTSGADTSVLEVKILPVDDGVTLLWQDVTKRISAEQALQRTADRLALAANGANEGWWELDIRTLELHVSRRWKALLGLDDDEEIARGEGWISRVHPDDAPLLRDAIKAHIEGRTERLQHEHRIRHADGTYRWFMCSGVRAPGRRPSRIAGSLSDVTDRVTAQERLRNAAFLDPLTGLPNRADFVDRVGRRLADRVHRPEKGRFAVLYLDLDRFKIVNDSLGHLTGDELLIAVSRRLESCLREEDCLGRLGGDEFAILLDSVHDDTQANAIAFHIQDVLKAPVTVTAGREVFTSASIGIAVSHAEYTSPEDIMRDADTAMYLAKSHGKACHQLFDAAMHARARDRLSLESDLRRAVSAIDFEVHYQPIVLLASGVCVGFESLIRWTRNGEKISPATFIPIAEELGLMESIGTWVLQRACHQFAEWQRRFPAAGLDCITVNASSRQLTQQNYPYLVEQAIQSARLRPQDLRIEVTETALMDAPNLVADVLTRLRELGVKIYLDDFGTGCSSLSHLHRLPVDALKVDRSFVMSLLLPDRPAIVESILALARTLKRSVVAEGIEDEKQARELERLGCTHAQGYLFSRPLSTGDVEAMLVANRPLGPKRQAERRLAESHAVYTRSNPVDPPAPLAAASWLSH